jgi:hypothetical protein
MSPIYEAVILFEICVDSTLTRIHREGEIRWRCHSDVYRNSIPPSFVTKFTKGISIHGPIAAFLTRGGEGIPALWPTSSRVQLQVSKSWPQEYESKHQNLLAQQERRLQGAWRNVVVVFPDTGWEAYSYYWLIVNTRSFFSSGLANGAVALVSFQSW